MDISKQKWAVLKIFKIRVFDSFVFCIENTHFQCILFRKYIFSCILYFKNTQNTFYLFFSACVVFDTGQSTWSERQDRLKNGYLILTGSVRLLY